MNTRQQAEHWLAALPLDSPHGPVLVQLLNDMDAASEELEPEEDESYSEDLWTHDMCPCCGSRTNSTKELIA